MVRSLDDVAKPPDQRSALVVAIPVGGDAAHRGLAASTSHADGSSTCSDRDPIS